MVRARSRTEGDTKERYCTYLLPRAVIPTGGVTKNWSLSSTQPYWPALSRQMNKLPKLQASHRQENSTAQPNPGLNLSCKLAIRSV